MWNTHRFIEKKTLFWWQPSFIFNAILKLLNTVVSIITKIIIQNSLICHRKTNLAAILDPQHNFKCKQKFDL
jgi:hypothetical protein